MNQSNNQTQPAAAVSNIANDPLQNTTEPIFVDHCTQSTTVIMDGCTDELNADVGAIYTKGLGRILKVNFTLKCVCPNKRVAVMVAVTELDCENNEYPRGTRYFVIPSRICSTCRDIEVKCVKFVLPEDLDIADTPYTFCEPRRFRVSVLAHYIDTAQPCCQH